ncbi:MAG: hypothetical protein ACYTG7_10490 [Planctomycetota bacterium]|jgi:Tfp pilus assembly protein PilO
MKFSNSILFIILIVGVGILFFFAFYLPTTEAIKDLKQEISTGQIRNDVAERVSLELLEKKRSLLDLRTEVKQLKESLLSPHEYSMLMTDLRALFRNFDFMDKSISLLGEERREKFEVAVVELRLRSGFEDLYRFLVALEDLSYAVQVEKLDLRTEEQAKGDLIARMTLSAPLCKKP